MEHKVRNTYILQPDDIRAALCEWLKRQMLPTPDDTKTLELVVDRGSDPIAPPCIIASFSA